MKLVVGMGTIDDYISYVNTGADEIFIGYAPEKWILKHKPGIPLNRREVCYYNVQIGSESELDILKGLVEKYRIPVTIAFNSLHYPPEEFPLIRDLMSDCLEKGFSSVIIADFALLYFLYKDGLGEKLDIHISGEFGEINHYIWKELISLGAKRLIFHRKVSPDSMKHLITERYGNTQSMLQYEAFFLNEKCHFHGGFCQSIHCDEMAPICRLPYEIGRKEKGEACEFPFDQEKTTDFVDENVIGQTGCGLCGLWDLREAGVTHLKIVGRGLHAEDMLRDIRGAKRALEILECSDRKEDYIGQMKRELFPEGCSKNCYYFGDWS